MNVKDAVAVPQIVAREMIKCGIQGSIVHWSSQAFVRPIVDHAFYCANKAALDMFGRCMAQKLGGHGIRVNSVNPTVVLTEMGKKNWSCPEKTKGMLDKMALKRFAEVDDVVNAVLFLLSDHAAMTTGAAFPVGRWLHGLMKTIRCCALAN